jgi:plasmid maintenance system antidote protein VapI
MTQTEISNALGVSRQRVNEMFTGKVGIGKKMALRLEKITGIPVEAWIFPDRHENPYLPKPTVSGKPN